MSGNRNKRKRKEAAENTPVKVDRRPARSPAVSGPAKPVPVNAPVRTGSRKEITLVVLLIIIATAIAYSNLYRNEFTNFDDNLYITENAHTQNGLSLDGVKWAFSFEDKEGTYWHPFTWLTLMAIHEVFGLNSAAFHLANLFIHILNSLLLFFILKRMTSRIFPSGLVAMLFALHPLNVEAVAWAVEIKTTASTFFGLLTIYLYTWYVQQKNIKRYAACLVCFCACLMFKSHLATLPFVLLLLDWWPLNRVDISKSTGEILSRIKPLVFEKIPLFLLSAASVVMSVLSLERVGGMEQASPLGFAFRVENALVSYVAYIFKLLLPIRLAVFYPNPASYALWKPACAAALLIVVTFAVIRGARKHPWLAVGWLWYLGALFPMLGLVRAGSWPAMADRFTYFSMIGLFMIVAWGCVEIESRLHIQKQKLPAAKGALFASLALILICFLTATWVQVGYWRSSIALYDHALSVAGPIDRMLSNRGIAYFGLGNYKQALEDYTRAITINPKYDEAYNNRGNANCQLGSYRQALEDYNKAIEINSGCAYAFNNRGYAYCKLGNYNQAISDFDRAIEINPKYADAYKNRGIIYNSLGNQKASISDLKAAAGLGSEEAKNFLKSQGITW